MTSRMKKKHPRNRNNLITKAKSMETTSFEDSLPRGVDGFYSQQQWMQPWTCCHREWMQIFHGDLSRLGPQDKAPCPSGSCRLLWRWWLRWQSCSTRTVASGEKCSRCSPQTGKICRPQQQTICTDEDGRDPGLGKYLRLQKKKKNKIKTER